MVKMIQKSKQNKRLLFVFVIILLLAAGAVAAIKMLLPADARALYFKAESRNFEKYSKWINDNYASYIEKQRPYIENNYRRRIEITADADFGGEASGQKVSKGLSDLIKGSKLVVDIKRQPADNSATSVVSLLLWKQAAGFTLLYRFFYRINILALTLISWMRFTINFQYL